MTPQDIKPGYKQSTLGPIPNDWNVATFSEIADIDKNSLSGNTNPEYSFNYISLGDVDSENLNIETSRQTFKTAPSRARKIVKQGDILMSTVRPYLQGFIIVREKIEDLIASTGFAVMTCKNCSAEYLFQYLFSSLIQKQFNKLLVGSNYPAINSSDVKKLKIPLPPSQNEQEGIADILLKIDLLIQKTKFKCDKTELRNKGLIQKLLTGKIRLGGFNGPVEYSKLGNYITEITTRNKNNVIKTVLSVTNSRGFINQDDQFAREIASTDKNNYKIIKKGQFAYNPSRVNVGSIDLLRDFEIGVLSPMYVVFKSNEKELLSEFLFYHLKSHRFYGHIPMFVQGSVRDSLGFDGLSEMTFFIPSIEEQQAITNILNKANEQLNLYKQKLEKLQELKKGLMQQLLTGRIRIKEFSN